MNTATHLTQEQAKALHAWILKHGRGWRAALSTAWTRSAAGPELQQVRNTLGPSWLSRVKADEVAARVVAIGQ